MLQVLQMLLPLMQRLQEHFSDSAASENRLQESSHPEIGDTNRVAFLFMDDVELLFQRIKASSSLFMDDTKLRRVKESSGRLHDSVLNGLDLGDEAKEEIDKYHESLLALLQQVCERKLDSEHHCCRMKRVFSAPLGRRREHSGALWSTLEQVNLHDSDV